MSLPVFDSGAVSSALPMSACIDLMATTQSAISRGDITLPLRTSLPLQNTDASLLVMPGALSDPPVFGAKLVSLLPENATRGLPVIQGQVLLFSGETGTPLALIEAATLTAIRTAAASGSATRTLARADASHLALLGYGVQAHSHLAAMRAVRDLRKVTVWGPDPVKARAFADNCSDRLSIEAAATPEDAVRGADLICAVSGAIEPVIKGEWLSPGCHLNLVGSHTPSAREADGAVLARARIFTEITEFALAESGDILLALAEGAITVEDIAGEIGDVLNGAITGRETPDEITLYKSLGNIAQDLAAAYHVLENG